MAKPKQPNRYNHFQKKWQHVRLISTRKKRVEAFNKQKGEKNETQQAAEISNKKRKFNPEKWTAIGTIVLAAATIALSYYTFMLFKDATDANDRDAKRFEIENRPFVQITDITFDTLTANKKIQAHFLLYNLGKFPAKIINAKYKFIFMPVGAQDTIEKVGPYANSDSNNILAGVLKIQHVVSTYYVITDEMLNDIKSGAVAGYLIGSYEYADIMNGKKYSCSFIYKLIPYPRYNVIIIKNEEVEVKGD